MSEIVDPIALRRKYREALIAERTKQEQQVNNWKRVLLTCSKEKILDKIPVDVESLTYESLFPELYKDVIDEAAYDEQYNKAMELINFINNLVNEHNKKGVEVLKEFGQLSV